LPILSTEPLLHIIQQAQLKDQKAQTQIVNIFWVEIFYFALQKTGNQQDSDDLTVKIFTKVLDKIGQYNPLQNFKPWLYKIAQNTIIDFYRLQNLSTSSFDEDLHNNQLEKSPEELMICQEEYQALLQNIKALDAKYQEIIQLRFFEEKSIQEISNNLNISPSNTKVRIMRAKQILADLIHKKN
jgi:RNA polymerase sigma factor (sigma-70 family)